MYAKMIVLAISVVACGGFLQTATVDDEHKAMQENAKGILFLFQANPGFELSTSRRNRAGFDEVIAAMVTGAQSFGKPLILAHGTLTHVHRTRHLAKPSMVGCSVSYLMC